MTAPIIEIVTAPRVYVAAGRRYFSKEAAIHRLAYRLCMEEAGCDCGRAYPDDGACDFHSLGSDEMAKAVRDKEHLISFVDKRDAS